MPRNQKPEEYFWIDKDQNKILMTNMSPDYLQRAHTHMALKELDLWHKLNNFNELKEQLETIADLRGVKLQDPDQLSPQYEWGSYFVNRRKTKAMPACKKEKTEQSPVLDAMVQRSF